MSSPSRSRLRSRDLVTEAGRLALALPVATGVTILIVAAVCAFILATTGQTVRAEQEVLGQMDEAGTRLITVIDDQGTAGLTPSAVNRLERLTSAEWVIGLSYATDARNSAIDGGQPAAVRHWWGELPEEVEINGRPPQPGEGLIGADAQVILGFDQPVGSVDLGDEQLSVVGGFTSSNALPSLTSGVLARPGAEQTQTARLRSIHLLATTSAQVEPLTRAISGLLGATDPMSVRFETSQALADVRTAVAGELGRFSHQLILAALGVGLLLVALVVYGSVTTRRQDFGRRRALGATRSTIIALIAVQNTLVGICGAALGTLAGCLIVWRLTGGYPGPQFAAAIAILAVLTVGVAAVPPAVIAAFRQPVLVLRVP